MPNRCLRSRAATRAWRRMRSLVSALRHLVERDVDGDRNGAQILRRTASSPARRHGPGAARCAQIVGMALMREAGGVERFLLDRIGDDGARPRPSWRDSTALSIEPMTDGGRRAGRRPRPRWTGRRGMSRTGRRSAQRLAASAGSAMRVMGTGSLSVGNALAQEGMIADDEKGDVRDDRWSASQASGVNVGTDAGRLPERERQRYASLAMRHCAKWPASLYSMKALRRSSRI